MSYRLPCGLPAPARKPSKSRISQGSYALPQSTQASVSVAFPGAQTAGNLNVVAIGWSDATSQVVSVVDTQGNSYAPAMSPTVQPGIQSHVIYYAANIAGAAANSVTVTFNSAVSYPDVRIAEYRGIATTSPVNAAGGSERERKDQQQWRSYDDRGKCAARASQLRPEPHQECWNRLHSLE